MTSLQEMEKTTLNLTAPKTTLNLTAPEPIQGTNEWTEMHLVMNTTHDVKLIELLSRGC